MMGVHAKDERFRDVQTLKDSSNDSGQIFDLNRCSSGKI
jgi:hypothetical protein